MTAPGKVTTPPCADTLAEAVVRVSAGFVRLQASGLNRKAIVVLLNDCTGVGKRDIERVLQGLGYLSTAYCKKAKG